MRGVILSAVLRLLIFKQRKSKKIKFLAIKFVFHALSLMKAGEREIFTCIKKIKRQKAKKGMEGLSMRTMTKTIGALGLAAALVLTSFTGVRSEERRVGKECYS